MPKDPIDNELENLSYTDEDITSGDPEFAKQMEKELSKTYKDDLSLENAPSFSIEDIFGTKHELFKEEETNLQELLDKTFAIEGGYSNDPNDRGGPTNFGITLKTYRNLVNPNATEKDIKALTKEEAKQIYIDHYYYGENVDELPPENQDLIFDMNVNHGGPNTAKLIQRAINKLGGNVDVDGVLGSETIKALEQLDQQQFREKLLNERSNFYNWIIKKDPKQKKFKKGWMNRVSSFRIDSDSSAV